MAALANQTRLVVEIGSVAYPWRQTPLSDHILSMMGLGGRASSTKLPWWWGLADLTALAVDPVESTPPAVEPGQPNPSVVKLGRLNSP